MRSRPAEHLHLLACADLLVLVTLHKAQQKIKTQDIRTCPSNKNSSFLNARVSVGPAHCLSYKMHTDTTIESAPGALAAFLALSSRMVSAPHAKVPLQQKSGINGAATPREQRWP